MDTRQLEMFVTVAEELSFTYAASSLRTAQSSVSERVRALERELGTVLFNRRGKEIELTLAGERALPEARLILEAATRLKALSGPHEQACSRLRIGVRAHPPQVDFSAIAREFYLSHPHVKLLIDASVAEPHILIENLRKGRLDMIITVLPDTVTGLEVHSILESSYAVVLSDESPLAALPAVSLADLPDYRWIDVQSGHGTRTVLDRALRHHGIVRNSMMELSDYREIPRLVGSFLGHAVLPEFLIVPTPGTVTVPLAEPIPWTLSVALREDATPACRDLMAIFTQQAERKDPPEITMAHAVGS